MKNQNIQLLSYF